MERIHIKDLERDEIRLCLYKDMRDRSGSISNRMLVRPVDLTEQEFIQLFEKTIIANLIDVHFCKLLYLRKTIIFLMKKRRIGNK